MRSSIVYDSIMLNMMSRPQAVDFRPMFAHGLMPSPPSCFIVFLEAAQLKGCISVHIGVDFKRQIGNLLNRWEQSQSRMQLLAKGIVQTRCVHGNPL